MPEEWLEEYYSRVVEEYKFSMERKDRVLDWSIGIFFIALVAYVELLRYQLPSIWRICLIVGLLCFMIRLFSNSCLAYAYLKKWRYLLDSIEKHWASKEESLDLVKNEIERYHYTPRTTERRIYFVKHQLVGGFFLLFLLPLVLLVWDIYSNLQNLKILAPIMFLVAYFAYEAFIFVKNKKLGMPAKNAAPPVSDDPEKMEKRRKHLDGLFSIALVLLGILSAAEFQYFLLKEKAQLHFYALKVFTVPFVVLIILWLVKELFGDIWRLDVKMVWTEFCWEFLNFSLFYYLLAIYGGFQIGIYFSLFVTLIMTLLVVLAYRRASPVTEGDRSMYNFYKSPGWVAFRITVFIIAYLLLIAIVNPWELASLSI